MDTGSNCNCIGVVGYIPPVDVVQEYFYDYVEGYVHIWCVDPDADLDRSILKLPTEDIIVENYELEKPTKGKGKKGESECLKKRKTESEGRPKLKGGGTLKMVS